MEECKNCGHEIVLGWISLKNNDKEWHHKINDEFFQIGCPLCKCNNPEPKAVEEKE